MQHDQNQKTTVFLNKHIHIDFETLEFGKFIFDDDGETLNRHKHSLVNMLFDCIEHSEVIDYNKIQDYAASTNAIYNLIDYYCQSDVVNIIDEIKELEENS